MEEIDNYSSGNYYKEIYIPRAMDLKTATLWMKNYFHIIEKIYPEIDDYKDKAILEIGSGFGGFVNVLNENGFSFVTASDMISDFILKELKNEFIILNLLDCDLREKKFDLIFAFDVMEHINESEKAIRNIFKLLNNEGFFIFCVPYPVKKHLMDNHHTNMQYPNFYTNLFYRNGFKLVEMQNISFLPYIWRWGRPGFVKKIFQSRFFISETFFIFKKQTNAV